MVQQKLKSITRLFTQALNNNQRENKRKIQAAGLIHSIQRPKIYTSWPQGPGAVKRNLHSLARVFMLYHGSMKQDDGLTGGIKTVCH